MTIFDVILIGVALAMDAMALTIANCTAYKSKLNKLQEWSMPMAFSLFQFLMPVIGFYIGSLFAEYISKVSGYITSAVFFALALKIVFDKLNDKEEQTAEFSFGILIVQGIATSIDALVVGVTLAISFNQPFTPSLIIGGVTFVLVALSLFFGKYLGKFLGKYAAWAGAVILGALAIKNLVEAIIG